MGNRTRPFGPVRRLVALGALAAAVPAAALWPGVAAARGHASSALYYGTRTATGLLAIDRLSLAGPRTSVQVVPLPNVGVFGMAVARRQLYWVTETAPADRGSIMTSGLSGQRVRSLVSGLPAPNAIAVAGGFVYWSDQYAIGRVALDGSRRQRRFLVLPQEPGGGVADGLATDGTHLYFSRCTENAIGRVDLSRRHLALHWLMTGLKTCPQGLSAAARHLYWTQLGSGTIGRVRLDGGGSDGRWLNIHSDQGPFQLASDDAHIYWTWGGVNGSPAWAGRASINGSHADRRFLANAIYPLALAGGA